MESHGGKREGAGRPPLSEEKREKVFPMLTPSLRKYAEKIGDGNLSRGLVVALEAHRRGVLIKKLGGVGPAESDTYDGQCPECGAFAVFWSSLEEYIKNPSGHYACENGHAR